jgi:site-specific recombinase XerD
MKDADDQMADLEPADDASSNRLGRENSLVVAGELALVPAFIAAGGEKAGFAFIDFFTAQIRNRNTRAAYGVAVRAFFDWCDARHLTLATLRTHHVATYIELLGKRYSAPTTKQHLAAIRMLFDWLVVRQVVEMNPAAAVRGQKHVVKKGKTPILEADEARHLLESIDTSTLVGLRDRALIGLLIYTFARVSAAIHMNVEDYFVQGRRSWVRLHEKGGKHHEMPAHHLLETYVDEYLAGAGIESDKASPLFRTAAGKTGKLTERGMHRMDALRMIQRRSRDAGIETEIGCHSFRATGITVYLMNGGLLEHAQQMAAHESARTTKLYDRRNDNVSLDEVERIVL